MTATPPANNCSPSFMHLLQVDWTTAAQSWRACLWLKLPVLIGFFAVPPVSLGAYQNMVLFLLICVTRCIGSQLLSASLIGSGGSRVLCLGLIPLLGCSPPPR